MSAEALLTLDAVAERTGMERSIIMAAVARGKFPAPVETSVRPAFSLCAVSEWIDKRIAAAAASAIFQHRGATQDCADGVMTRRVEAISDDPPPRPA